VSSCWNFLKLNHVMCYDRCIFSQNIRKHTHQEMNPAGSGGVWHGAGNCRSLGVLMKSYWSERQTVLPLHTDWKYQAFRVTYNNRVHCADTCRMRSSTWSFTPLTHPPKKNKNCTLNNHIPSSDHALFRGQYIRRTFLKQTPVTALNSVKDLVILLRTQYLSTLRWDLNISKGWIAKHFSIWSLSSPEM
jgi:hypothetical protein